jgi:hypothetical protein
VSSLSPSSAALQPRGVEKLGSIPKGTTRLYARQIEAGAGHELKVYFTPEAKQLLCRSNEKGPNYPYGRSQAAARTATGFRYIIEEVREDADVSVDVHQGIKPPEIVVSLCHPQTQEYDEKALKYRVEVNQDKVDAALFVASRWNWHRTYKNPLLYDSVISLEFGKLGERHGDDTFVPIPGPWTNLKDGGMVKIRVRAQDEYGIKLTNHSDVPLHMCAFYFSASDFSTCKLLYPPQPSRVA